MNEYSHQIEISSTLKEYVDSVWCTHGKPANHVIPDLLIPNGLPEIKFILNGGFKIKKMSSNHNSFKIYKSMIIGIQDQMIMNSHIDNVRSIGIKFDPMTFYLLFGHVGIDIVNKHIPLEKFQNNYLIQLDKRLNEIESVNELLNVIESFFSSYKAKVIASSNWMIVSRCLTYLKQSKGIIDIKKLEEELHKSKEELNVHFKNYIGLSIEEMAYIIINLEY